MIAKIENYFYSEINQRYLCSKKLSKYVTVFYHVDKILIVLSATTGGVYIVSHATIVGAPVRIASVGFAGFVFFLGNRNNTKVIMHNKKLKEKGW